MAGVGYRDYRLADVQSDRHALGSFTAAALHVESPVRWRPLDYVELMAVFDGEGLKTENTTAGPRSFRLTRGRLFLVRSGTEHAIEAADPGGCSIIIVSMALDDWQTFADLLGVDPSWSTTDRPPVVTVPPERIDDLRPFQALVEPDLALTRLELLRFLVLVVPLLLPIVDHRKRSGNDRTG